MQRFWCHHHIFISALFWQLIVRPLSEHRSFYATLSAQARKELTGLPPCASSHHPPITLPSKLGETPLNEVEYLKTAIISIRNSPGVIGRACSLNREWRNHSLQSYRSPPCWRIPLRAIRTPSSATIVCLAYYRHHCHHSLSPPSPQRTDSEESRTVLLSSSAISQGVLGS